MATCLGLSFGDDNCAFLILKSAGAYFILMINRLKDKLLLVGDLSSYIQLCYVSFLLVGVSFFAAS